jgi:hypothetical protein
MEHKKLTVSIMVAGFALIAFLGGYLLTQQGIGKPVNNSNETGSILQKFEQNKNAPADLPTDELVLLGDYQAVSPTDSSESGNILFYDKQNGKIIQTELKTGKESIISATTLPGFISSQWSPDKNQVISVFNTSSGNQLKYYNLHTRKSVTYPLSITSAAFSPDGNQVAYFEKGATSNKIVISMPDLTLPKIALNTRIENISLVWPNKDKIALIVKEGDVNSSLYLLSPEGSFEQIITSQNGLKTKWSKSGDAVLYSFYGPEGKLLTYYRDLTSTEINIAIPLDAEKCTWASGKIIYCSVPRSSSKEDMYKLDLNNEVKEIIATPEFQLNTSEIFITPLENYIVILNGVDNKLYAMKIGE